MNIIRGTVQDTNEDGLTHGLSNDKAYRTAAVDGRYNETLQAGVYQHYGFYSMPYPGMEMIIVRDNNLYVSVAEQSALEGTVEKGDTVIYSLGEDDYGHSVLFLSPDGSMSMQSNPKLPSDMTGGQSEFALENTGIITMYYTPNDPAKKDICIEIDPATGNIHMENGKGTIDILGSTGQVDINNGNLTVDV